MVLSVGIDLGSQKTVIVADDGEIVRTDTGSISVPSLVSFTQQSRHVGDEAASYQSSDGTVSLLSLTAGRDQQHLQRCPYFAHRSAKSRVDEAGQPVFDIPYCNEQTVLPATSVLAIALGHHARRIQEVHGEQVRMAFVTPHGCSAGVARAYLEAALIAGIPLRSVDLVDAAEALVATYSRKITALRPVDRQALHGKNVVIIEMGHTSSRVIIVHVMKQDKDIKEDKKQPDEVAVPVVVKESETIGAMAFDMCLFDYLAKITEVKHGTKITPGTKRGQRLMGGCERLRKLLSQLNEAQTTVENLTDNGDVNFSIKRDELSSICEEPLRAFKELLSSALAEADVCAANPALSGGITSSNNTADAIAAVEILGGGVRMQVVQNAITEVLGEKVLGAKFDDGSAALGAALIANLRALQRSTSTATSSPSVQTQSEASALTGQDDSVEVAPSQEVKDIVELQSSLYTRHPTDSSLYEGFISPSLIEEAAQRELDMRSRDMEVKLRDSERNSMEAYMYEMKSALRSKHGALIDSNLMNARLQDYENWLWDNHPDVTSLDVLRTQFATMKSEVSELLTAYNEAVAAEKLRLEQHLESESKLAEAERAREEEANVGEDDHDNRKLKKSDRMRLVVKNKEEGNELFKGGNYRPAAARYHKALTHTSKFFDLSPDDNAEIQQLKLSLYLNLAQCYIKLENWEQTLKNVEDGLLIDPNNSKALFRRATALEAKKDYEAALVDYKRAETITPQDKMITKAIERMTKQIQKDKQKEKKMWGRAFGGGSTADSNEDTQQDAASVVESANRV